MTNVLQRNQVKINWAWAMPNHKTFSIKPISIMRKEELTFKNYIEPFPFQSKLDCFDYLSQFEDNSIDESEIDPPYTKRQVSEWYNEKQIKVTGWHTSSGWIAKLKDEIMRVMKPGGKVITYAYNTSGMGITRGFEKTRILIVNHGAEHNDTLCTVERKLKPLTKQIEIDFT